jgi:hypothetical protein
MTSGYNGVILLNNFTFKYLMHDEDHDWSVCTVRYSSCTRHTRQKLVHFEGNRICSLSEMPRAACLTVGPSLGWVRAKEYGVKPDLYVIRHLFFTTTAAYAGPGVA